MSRGWKAGFKRYGAPVAFLAAVTIAVLLVREGLQEKSAPSTSAVTTTASVTTTTNTRPQYYRVRSGETLSDVALRFSVTVDALLELNPGVQPSSLTIGQRIRVR